ncbi:TIGR03619 family F420-dependent LLM class oxidoreductase [Rhizorhapis sp.]|uniref:TIGR03619 family F420-dependent LLM class oxidoreductase n=1 Tax=Rhizorhapis sp. TaxID=1968842 RepID=UPI002B48005A|nr:TIGR03619 family F420-dependent LLM class oxidoreductase [Rhizorhapis sp.]HKR17304.1 TIGR03619 family F420-dependent LLM class oxidoreductase [Rhizorhapis sp.]
MRYGAVFPTADVRSAHQTRDLAQAYEDAGFDYIALAGHLLSARPGRYPGRPDYQYAAPFLDPFVLFSYLAATTSRIHFLSQVLILPLRETAAVARQAAELAFLSNNRFELGVGISWQEAEYRAAGQDVHKRGARLAEQVELLKLYWRQPLVTFKGEFHEIDEMGLARLPKNPIPIWFGSQFGEAAMRRAAALGDGWMPLGGSTDALPRFKEYVSEAGRDPNSIMLMGSMTVGKEGPDALVTEAQRLQGLGITHITVNSAPGATSDAAVSEVIEVGKTLKAAVP